MTKQIFMDKLFQEFLFIMEWIVKKILSERNVIVESVMSKDYEEGGGFNMQCYVGFIMTTYCHSTV